MVRKKTKNNDQRINYCKYFFSIQNASKIIDCIYVIFNFWMLAQNL